MEDRKILSGTKAAKKKQKSTHILRIRESISGSDDESLWWDSTHNS